MVLCLLHGTLFLELRAHDPVRERAVRAARVLAPVTVVVVVVFAFWTRLTSGNGILLSVPELIAVLGAVAARSSCANGVSGSLSARRH